MWLIKQLWIKRLKLEINKELIGKYKININFKQRIWSYFQDGANGHNWNIFIINIPR